MNVAVKKKAKSILKDKMHWAVKDQVFEDGSMVQEWEKIEGSPWIPQDEGYELSFDIYRHHDQFWKLYIARWIPEGAAEYAYAYGGVACRIAEVRYKTDKKL